MTFVERFFRAVLVVVIGVLLVGVAPPASAQGGPTGLAAALDGQVLPPSNWWNLDVSAAPVDARSTAWIDWVSNRTSTNPTAIRRAHPDFGPPPYGIPYVVVSGPQARVPVTFVEYGSESDAGAPGLPPGYPIPDAARTTPGYIEGGVAGGGTSGDRHLLIVDRDRWLLYETYHTRWNASASRWEAGSGAVFDLATNARRPEGWTSADAAGLAILPGLVRYDEAFGPDEITHAFRVTLRATNGHVWPASHTAGSNPSAPPMGARLRLKSAKNLDGYAPEIRRIFRAMQRYGLIVADNGSDLYITGTTDPRWNNDVLNPAFRSLTADDFEFVQAGWNPSVVPEPVKGDFTGDGAADAAVFRPQGGTWYVDGAAPATHGLAGDWPVPADYDGDGRIDVAVFRPWTGTWYVRGAPPVTWGQPGDLPVPADYDGDGRADIAVFRPASGAWYVRGQTTDAFGTAGDLPVPADYDDDGRADLAVFRPASGTWHIRGRAPQAFGAPGDVPVPADYNGDRRTDLAVFRPSTGVWYLRHLATVAWGQPGDLPVALDHDGDGRAELGVFRRATGTWYFRAWITGASSATQYGQPGDRPALWPSALRQWTPGDADGDGRADLTTFREADATWLGRTSGSAFLQGFTVAFGLPTDVPWVGDADADRRQDLGIFRAAAGSVSVRGSLSGYQVEATGVAASADGDVMVPGDYDGDGRSDVAWYRPAAGRWTVVPSTGGAPREHAIGGPGAAAVPADFDGDGRTDAAVFDPATGRWTIRASSRGDSVWREPVWGQAGDVPMAADVDGDGRADPVVFRRAMGRWFVLESRRDYATSWSEAWGAEGDVPVAADFDGDGRADLAAYRAASGTWYVRQVFTAVWGGPGQRPLP